MNKRRKNKREAMFIEGIPRKDRNAFKAACAGRDKSMREVILDFMRGYVRYS